MLKEFGPRKMLRATGVAVAVLAGAVPLAGCGKEADVASYNLSVAADQFEVNRRVVFYNGITDRTVMVMEGRCSLGNNETKDKRTVTCKTGPNTYMKHIFQLSDNMTLFAEQLEPTQESGYHYRRVFMPQQVIPDVDLRVDTKELLQDRH